jgi:hypothetical protein
LPKPWRKKARASWVCDVNAQTLEEVRDALTALGAETLALRAT